jgi:hypothetical protein
MAGFPEERQEEAIGWNLNLAVKVDQAICGVWE